MTKCLSEDLRVRVIAAVDDGLSRWSAPARFGIAAASAVRWVREWRETGVACARRQGEAPDRLYGVGMVNFWDIEAARESVEHIISLGLCAIMAPINSGRAPDGTEIQYSSPAMAPFWSAIEDSRFAGVLPYW